MKDRLTILCGDALEQLKTLPDESVHCCVTSPPYWGLRDYGVPGQLGLEKTPEEYVSKMVEVFREVKRVLREDGTLWLNLGDSYWGGGNYRGINSENTLSEKQKSNRGATGVCQELGAVGKSTALGLKPKDLCGIPWRVAFALQNDGWYLRSDIIWHKPNPMPESVTDRPTKSHEYLFLLSKNERYFYDAEAIKEKFADERMGNPGNYLRTPSSSKGANNDRQDLGFLNNGNGWNADQSLTGRNKRSVWTVPSFAFPESHFATYPPDLIKPCILAGTSAKGCCEKCGAPWERQVEKEFKPSSDLRSAGDKGMDKSNGWAEFPRGTTDTKTIGWQPTCECNAGVIPCTVLDCFGGSGTSGMVALELGRKAILIELNPEYVHLIKQRCDVTPGLPLA